MRGAVVRGDFCAVNPPPRVVVAPTVRARRARPVHARAASPVRVRRPGTVRRNEGYRAFCRARPPGCGEYVFTLLIAVSVYVCFISQPLKFLPARVAPPSTAPSTVPAAPVGLPLGKSNPILSRVSSRLPSPQRQRSSEEWLLRKECAVQVAHALGSEA